MPRYALNLFRTHALNTNDLHTFFAIKPLDAVAMTLALKQKLLEELPEVYRLLVLCRAGTDGLL